MSRITESAKTEKPADKVFEFLSNIKEMPKWSYVIKGIETNPDGTFKGETSYGPLILNGMLIRQIKNVL